MTPTETTHNPAIDQLQKLHRRRMAIFGSIILIAGIAIGAASTVILMPPPKPPGPGDPDWAALMMVDRLGPMLDLTSEQEEDIRQIAMAAFKTLHEIQEKAKPEIDAVVKDMNEKISKILTPEQRETWQRKIEDFQRDIRERWRRGGRRPGEGGPGRPRGPGEPDRFRRGPGRRPDDPNRPRNGFGPGQGDPNRSPDAFRRGPGRFGPGFGPGDPNRPRGDFDREAMRDRYRRGGEPFGRRPRPDDPNRPPPFMNPDAATEPNKTD